MKAINFLWFVIAMLSSSSQALLGQDIYLSGGYINSNHKEFSNGEIYGIRFKYNFSPKFSQDIGFSYGRCLYSEEVYDEYGNYLFYSTLPSQLYSLRTHSICNFYNEGKDKFTGGLGLALNFWSPGGHYAIDDTNVGIGAYFQYDRYDVFKLPLGVFVEVRIEDDPSIFGQVEDANSPFRENTFLFEISTGLRYVLWKKNIKTVSNQ